MARRDVLSRLADAGEEAIARFATTPGADRLLGPLNAMRERVDELQRRVRGIDDLERRVAALEGRLGAQLPAAATPARSDRPPAPSTNVSGGTPRRRVPRPEPTAPPEEPAPPAGSTPPPAPTVPPAATLPPTVGGSTEPAGS